MVGVSHRRAGPARPIPYWDPLEFAVREAHARGLELHAWFNPYRAQHDASQESARAARTSARTHPALVKRTAAISGWTRANQRVRRRTLAVILDVVKRYDVDGVHIDDYFYPYPVERQRAVAASCRFPTTQLGEVRARRRQARRATTGGART